MSTAIDYAPRLPWHRSPRLRRRAIFLLSLVLLLAAAYLLGPRIYHRILLLHYQRQCMTHLDPPGTLVMEFPPTPPGTLYVPATGITTSHDWEIFLEEALTNERYASDHPMLYFYLGSWYLTTDYPVFLHRLTSPAGDRLVVARAYHGKPGPYWPGTRSPGVMIFTFSPANFLSNRVHDNRATDFPLNILETSSLRLYAAQPDPADPASFTLTFDLDSVHYTAHFTLAPTGHHINLTSLTPPLPTFPLPP